MNAPFGHIAYKTGTSYGYRDAFAIGLDKAHTIAVWLGQPDNGSVFGLAGRQAAAPVLFGAFARLGTGHEFFSPPAGILASRTASLPPALAAFAQGRAQDSGGGGDSAIKNRFPAGWRPRRSRLPDLAAAARATARRRLALKAEGGVLPLRWIVNGTPVEGRDLRRQAAWTPDGAGFARVSIIDARGERDRVLVRLE